MSGRSVKKRSLTQLAHSLNIVIGQLAARHGLRICGALLRPPPESDSRILGRTEFKEEKIKEAGPGFGLRVAEPVDLPPLSVDRIADFYPYDGLDRLRGGGCIRFLRNQPARDEPPDRRLIGARILLDPSLCADLPPPGKGIRAIPCPGDASGSPLAGWYLSCKHLAAGWSALVAIGSGPATKGRVVTLAAVDEQIRFFHLFGIHWDGGEVTTLGTRTDGMTLISRYTWYARVTGK